MSKTKKKGGIGQLMKAQARQGKGVTEEELKNKDVIGPDDVNALSKACEGFLCKPTANTFGIEFTAFKLRDLEREVTLFEVAKPADMPYEPPSDDDDDSSRFVRYEFNREFLKLQRVGATVTFRIGDNPVKNFRMIERHFFKGKLLKSFDFDFGFCIPGSVNTCEHLYELPKLSKDEMAEMIASPTETKSDSFYFVDGKLIMHNRADYTYQ